MKWLLLAVMLVGCTIEVRPINKTAHARVRRVKHIEQPVPAPAPTPDLSKLAPVLRNAN